MKRLSLDMGCALFSLVALMLLLVAVDGSGPMAHWLVCYLAGLGVVSMVLVAVGLKRDE